MPAAVPTRLPDSFGPMRDWQERSATMHNFAASMSAGLGTSAASLAPTERCERIGVGTTAISSGSSAAVAVVTVLQCSGHAQRVASGGPERGPPHVYCTARLGAAEYKSRTAGGKASWEPRLNEVFVFALPVTDSTDDAAAQSVEVGEEAEWVDIRVLDAHPVDSGRAELGRARVSVPKAGAGPVEAWYPLIHTVDDADGSRGRRQGLARSQGAGRILVRANRAQVQSAAARRCLASINLGPSAESDAASHNDLPTLTRAGQHTEWTGTFEALVGGCSVSNRPEDICSSSSFLPSPPRPSPKSGSVTGVPAAAQAQQTPSPLPACDSDEGCEGDGSGGGGWAGQLVRPPRMSSAPARPRNR